VAVATSVAAASSRGRSCGGEPRAAGRRAGARARPRQVAGSDGGRYRTCSYASRHQAVARLMCTWDSEHERSQGSWSIVRRDGMDGRSPGYSKMSAYRRSKSRWDATWRPARQRRACGCGASEEPRAASAVITRENSLVCRFLGLRHGTVYLTTVYKNGGKLPGPRPLGRTHQMWISRRTWRSFST